MKRRTRIFLRESVILFGFLNGLWLAIGVNPGAALLEVAKGAADNLLGAGGPLDFIFTFLPLALGIVALVLIYRRAGWLGFLAVGLAFLAGAWILAETKLALVLMAGAVALGILATR